MNEIKELIYKDAYLLECLFKNIAFNLHECALTNEEKDDIAEFRRLLGRNLVENISKIVRPSIENERETKVEEVKGQKVQFEEVNDLI